MTELEINEANLIGKLKDAWIEALSALDERGMPFDTVKFRSSCDTARGLIDEVEDLQKRFTNC